MKARGCVAALIASVTIAGSALAGATTAEAATARWVGPFNSKAQCQYAVQDMVMRPSQLIKNCELHNRPGDDGKWWFKMYN